MYVFVIGIPYVRYGMFLSGDCKMARISVAVWRRYCSDVTMGKGTFSGEKSTVSVYILPPVLGIQHV